MREVRSLPTNVLISELRNPNHDDETYSVLFAESLARLLFAALAAGTLAGFSKR